RSLCPGWDAINAAEIQQTKLTTEFLIHLLGAPCNYQRAVATKYHIGSLNFLSLLTPNDCAYFAFIARISLHSQTNYSQYKNYNYTKILYKKLYELETANAEDNYKNSGSQLQASLKKLAKWYNAAKAKSIPVLTSFLHNIRPNNDLLACVKSEAKICVQIDSVKHIKHELDIKNFKENNNPHIIPAYKVQTISKRSILLVKI
ncbi:1917_t:CDS:2, partial [Dentiscutata erythropus]